MRDTRIITMLKTRLDTANEAPMAGPGRNIVFGGLDQNTVFVEGRTAFPPAVIPMLFAIVKTITSK
jgi:hypothetical protein